MRVFMSDVSENFSYRLDWFKWLLVVVIISGSIYANWYYSEESLLYRVIGFLVAVLISGFIASLTFRGKALISLAFGARTEWKKVVWPTKQERNQTTLIVLAVIVLMALILWGIDSFFSWIAKLIMG